MLAVGTASREAALRELTWQQVDLRRGRIRLDPDGRLQRGSSMICWLKKHRSRVDRTSFGTMFGAGNETRTRDPDLGKVVLYQLSYSRIRLIPRAAEFYVHPFGSQGESPSGLRPSLLIRNTDFNTQ